MFWSHRTHGAPQKQLARSRSASANSVLTAAAAARVEAMTTAVLTEDQQRKVEVLLLLLVLLAAAAAVARSRGPTCVPAEEVARQVASQGLVRASVRSTSSRREPAAPSACSPARQLLPRLQQFSPPSFGS
jgi:hypothetical protein